MKTALSWLLRLVAAAILLQAASSKFTGQEDVVTLFTRLGMEPAGRILIGTLEALAAVMILVPYSIAYGALLGIGVMTGALIGHFTELGVTGEMGSLTLMAFVVLASCIGLLCLHGDRVAFLRNLTQRRPDA